MKRIYLILAFGFSSLAFAQNDKAEIEKTVQEFFKAMYNADSESLKNTFSESIVFQTIDKNGNAKTEDAQKFAAGIAKFQKGDLNEKIKIKKILTDGQLASVWMTYEFVHKGKTSHCGVNSFQLVKSQNQWKVQYIIDTRRKCN